jgi:hypothetical protein
MHLEKLAKAQLWDPTKTQPDLPEFHRTHNVIAKVLPLLVKQSWKEAGYSSPPEAARVGRIRDICRQIDLLCPAVDDSRRRLDNCEYPWPSQNSESIDVPCDTTFEVENRLRSKDGEMLLKVAGRYAQTLAGS